MARIPLDLVVGQFGAVFDDRFEPGEIAAGDRRDDGDLVAIRDRSVVAAGADILVVDIDPDEIAEFAVVGIEMLAQLVVRAGQVAQDLANGLARHIDRRLSAGIPAQRRGNGDCDCHGCEFLNESATRLLI